MFLLRMPESGMHCSLIRSRLPESSIHQARDDLKEKEVPGGLHSKACWIHLRAASEEMFIGGDGQEDADGVRKHKSAARAEIRTRRSGS
jgi:hypothetical protein